MISMEYGSEQGSRDGDGRSGTRKAFHWIFIGFSLDSSASRTEADEGRTLHVRLKDEFGRREIFKKSNGNERQTKADQIRPISPDSKLLKKCKIIESSNMMESNR